MFKSILDGVESMQILANLSLVLFFIVFIVIIIWTLGLDKKFINYMKNLPFNDDLNSDLNKGDE